MDKECVYTAYVFIRSQVSGLSLGVVLTLVSGLFTVFPGSNSMPKQHEYFQSIFRNQGPFVVNSKT